MALMTHESVEARLTRLGIVLPESNAPAANYVPYVQTGNLVFIAGQTCKADGTMVYRGRIDNASMIPTGKLAARLCGLNLLIQLKNACGGDLNRVTRCVRIGVLVQTASEFSEHAKIADGVSDLMLEVFGEKGQHTRMTAGCYTLPSDSMVEADAIFEVMV
jgi:enamine deaminase RidA (YjgF/YER057c/UK114 family)